MKWRKALFAAAAVVATIAGSAASASLLGGMSYGTDATGFGSANGFANAYGYTGSATNLAGVMSDAASGANVFSGVGFGSHIANIFFADLTGSGNANLQNAGLTMFVMLGNGSPSTGFNAIFNINPSFGEGTDGTFGGTSQAYALGTDVSFNTGTPGQITAFGSGVTPQGFAITNLETLGIGNELNMSMVFNAGSGVFGAGLFGEGQGLNGLIWTAVDQLEGDAFGDNIAFIHVIPLPPAAWMGLAGLAGIAVLRRRRAIA